MFYLTRGPVKFKLYIAFNYVVILGYRKLGKAFGHKWSLTSPRDKADIVF